MLRRENGIEDDEDLEERASFLKNETPGSHRIGLLEIGKEEGGHRLLRPSRSRLTAITSVFCIIMIFVLGRSDRSIDGVVDLKNDSLFSCPLIEKLDDTNESAENFEELYGQVSRNITIDKDQFLKTFRTDKYDGWGNSYNDMKKGMTPFKSKFFSPYLRPGMKMYESACGIGLNLLMTLEILQELPNSNDGNGLVSGITVYGNEYVKESVQRSEMVLGEGVIPAGNQRGVICTGDSTNLSHVPSNAFDLVYSGYLTPLQDPLNIDPADDWGRYDDVCNSVKKGRNRDWMGQKLWDLAQKRQRDWFGKWVGEMARIAKPGVPVIVEQVSLSYCTNQNDWGGVDKKFWFEAAEENSYNWNVDPNSIEMMSDTIHEDRYHVFMLKNEG